MNSLKELKELLTFGFTLVGAIVKTWEDKKVNVWDTLNFAPVVKTIKPAFDNLGNPIDRWNELTPGERQELFDWAFEKFDIPNDKVEELIERTLHQVTAIVRLVNDWKNVKKK